MRSLGSFAYQTLKTVAPTIFELVPAAEKTWLIYHKTLLRQQFLQSCLDADVLPKFLSINIPQHIVTHNRFFRQAQKKTLEKEIRNVKEEASRLLSNLRKVQQQYTEDGWRALEAVLHHHNNKKLRMIQHRHARKVTLLLRSQRSQPDSENQAAPTDDAQQRLFQMDCLINLSKVELTQEEEEALRLGFSMAWPSTVSPLDIKTESEVTFDRVLKTLNNHNVNKDDIDFVRSKLKSLALSYIRNKSKIPKAVYSQLKSLRALSRNSDLFISRFDKGNGICIDTKSNYLDKMNNFLSDTSKFSKYHPHANAKKDPFLVAEDRLNRNLLKLHKEGAISFNLYSQMRSTGSQPARLYGLPKVHKSRTDPPYRPILSMPNSYTTNLNRTLDSLLKPFIPTGINLKDSFEFVDSLKAISSDDKVFVSFDVISLFPNVPLQDTIAHICSKIDFNLFPISADALTNLLNLACKNMIFQFNNDLYVQKDGVAMGSNLGPTMAAFAMDLVESKLPFRPMYYRRYVDDIFAIFDSKSDALAYLDILNSVHPNLQFTIETQNSEGSLRFLDVDVSSHDNKFKTCWSLKPTNTGRYTPFSSHSPLRYKKAAVRALIYRSKHLNTFHSDYEKSFSLIKSLFQANGYPSRLIDGIKHNIDNPINDNTSFDKPAHLIWRLPYVKSKEIPTLKTLKTINQIIPSEHRLLIVFKTFKSQNLFPNKDRVPTGLASNVIYKFQCEQCSSCYIGETRRHLSTRIGEHISGKPIPTEVTKHCHPSRPENFSIVARTKYTKIAESITLNSYDKSLILNEFESSVHLRLF